MRLIESKITTTETEIDLNSLYILDWPKEAKEVAYKLMTARRRRGMFPFSSKEELVQEVEAKLVSYTKLIDEL